MLDEDKGAYYCQCYVGTNHKPGEPSPETGLDEREYGDSEDERGEQVLSLVSEDDEERHEHRSHADRSPQLRHPAGVGLRLGDGACRVLHVGADGGTLTVSQALGMVS